VLRNHILTRMCHARQDFVHANVYKLVRVGVQDTSDVNPLFASQGKN
jgi:hypothetical protein